MFVLFYHDQGVMCLIVAILCDCLCSVGNTSLASGCQQLTVRELNKQRRESEPNFKALSHLGHSWNEQHHCSAVLCLGRPSWEAASINLVDIQLIMALAGYWQYLIHSFIQIFLSTCQMELVMRRQ